MTDHSLPPPGPDDTASLPPVRLRRPSPRPEPGRPVVAGDDGDQLRDAVMGNVMQSMFASDASRRWLGVLPPASELWRIGTDPYTGTTRVARHQLSIGCAGGLLAELMMQTRPDVVPGRPDRPLVATYAESDTGRPILAPDVGLYREDPPRDPLLYQVLDELIKDSRDSRRGLAEYIEYLAETAYLRVADRLTSDRFMTETSRRTWPTGRRQRIWTAVEPTSSLNAMNRIPRELRNHNPLSEADRILLGLIIAADLTGPIHHEYGRQIDWPDPADLALAGPLQQVVDATSYVVAAAARGHRR